MKIKLSKTEVQSGLSRVLLAEGLILQLPSGHNGKDSWLLNYGMSNKANDLRANYHTKLVFNAKTKCWYKDEVK